MKQNWLVLWARNCADFGFNIILPLGPKSFWVIWETGPSLLINGAGWPDKQMLRSRMRSESASFLRRYQKLDLDKKISWLKSPGKL